MSNPDAKPPVETRFKKGNSAASGVNQYSKDPITGEPNTDEQKTRPAYNPGGKGGFEKGKSGNPGGLSKTHREFIDNMRSNVPQAIEALVAGLKDARQAKGCAEVILAYAYGKPKQITEISGPDGGPINLGAGISGLLVAAMKTEDEGFGASDESESE